MRMRTSMNAEKIVLIDSNRIEPIITREVYDPNKYRQLKADIREYGISNPIHVIRAPRVADSYKCFIGNHRLKAIQELSKEFPERRFIPAIIEDISWEEAIAKGFKDNELTVPMNPMDSLKVIQTLSEKGKSYSEIAKAMFGSESHKAKVTQMIKLSKLPIPVQNRVKEDKLDWSKAVLLLDLEDEDKITDAAEETIDEDYSYRDVKKLVENDGFGESDRRLTDKNPQPKGLPVRCHVCGEQKRYEDTRSRQICITCLRKMARGDGLVLRLIDANLTLIEQELDDLGEKLGVRLTFAEPSEAVNQLTEIEPKPRPKVRPDTTWAKGLDEYGKHLCIQKAIQDSITCREARDRLLGED